MSLVIIVDDNSVDRYIIKRHLKRCAFVDDVIEFDAGDTFFDQYFSTGVEDGNTGPRSVVLMDINMPRQSGFETVAKMEAAVKKNGTSNACVVMMYSSSEHPSDLERAAGFDIVAGFIVKPFAQDNIADLERALAASE